MQTRAPVAAWYALGALSVALLYAMIDRQVLALLVQPLKADLHLSDTQIGSLQGLGSALFAAIAVAPLGWLADRVDRRLVLAGCILVWSAAAAACGLATGYWSLLFCVSLLAAGEAGLSPIVYSLIPELFPERQRMMANFIFYAATILAAGLGLALGGAVIDHVGVVAAWFPDGPFTRQTWRLVFFVVAVPAPFLALAIALIRLKPRPPQTPANAATANGAERQQLLAHLAANWKAIVGVFAPFGLAMLGATAIFTWTPVILMRQFGLTAGQVGAGFGSAIAIGSVVGLALAALAANFLKSKWGAMTPIRLPQFGYLIFGLLMPLYLVARSPNEIFLIATIQMAATTGSNSLMPTVVQNLAPGHLRGRVFAISIVIATLFQVISPISVGLLSDHVFIQAGGLLLSSVVIGTPALLLAAAGMHFAEKSILKTVEAMQALSDPA
jgi:MFS family permease